MTDDKRVDKKRLRSEDSKDEFGVGKMHASKFARIHGVITTVYIVPDESKQFRKDQVFSWRIDRRGKFASLVLIPKSVRVRSSLTYIHV